MYPRHVDGPGDHGYLENGQCPPEYRIWSTMIQRCCNEKCREFPRYGGRGIKVCERWLAWNGFANFIQDVGPRPEGAGISLHRVDNNGHYERDNVTWTDQKTQMRNRSNNHKLTVEGREMTLVEWAEELGMLPGTLCQRLRKGWPVEEALTCPVKPRMPSHQWKRNPNAAKRGPKPKPRQRPEQPSVPVPP